MTMTVADLMTHLSILPPEAPVYAMDHEGDWLPLRTTDVRYIHVTPVGWCTNRKDDFYVSIEDPESSNGVGIALRKEE